MTLIELWRKVFPAGASPVYTGGWNGYSGFIRESYSGAWQQNCTIESPKNLLGFSALYGCVSLISDDISKLNMKLMQKMRGGLSKQVYPFDMHGNDRMLGTLDVLRKPNPYQTHLQFIAQWLVAKLMIGNNYAFRQRDSNRTVVALYNLDPRLTVPLITPSGDVYYQIKPDVLSRVEESVVVPASEIAHDRAMTPWHPLVGVPPVYACGLSATQGLKIQHNSAKFFENMSRPSGQLSAPGIIPDETAARLKREFEERFGGGNLGRTFVSGSGIKYEPITMPPEQAQLIEQQKWTAEDVCRPFKVPLYKLGLAQPPSGNTGQLNQEYYNQCLQRHIEDIEALLDDLLGLPALGFEVEFDIESLLRMDPLSRAELNKTAVSGGFKSPNEARAEENRGPVDGGGECYLQQQNFSLSALRKRDAKDDPFGSATPKPALAPAEGADVPVLPPPPAAPSKDTAADIAEIVTARIDSTVQKLLAEEVERNELRKERDMERALLDLEAKFNAATV